MKCWSTSFPLKSSDICRNGVNISEFVLLLHHYRSRNKFASTPELRPPPGGLVRSFLFAINTLILICISANAIICLKELFFIIIFVIHLGISICSRRMNIAPYFHNFPHGTIFFTSLQVRWCFLNFKNWCFLRLSIWCFLSITLA